MSFIYIVGTVYIKEQNVCMYVCIMKVHCVDEPLS